MENSSNSVDSTATNAVADSGTDSGQVTEQNNEAPVLPKSNKKSFKLKVDGSEEDFEIDLDNEEELKRHFQMSKAANKRMAEAATTKKQIESFIRQLQQDPIAALQNPALKLNKDFRSIAEEYLAQQIMEETMSPQEKKLRDAERIIREREEESRSKREQEELQQRHQLEQHYAQQFEKVIQGALSESNVPKTTATVRRMAQLMSKNLEHGYDLEPKQLAELVRQDYLRDIQELFGATEGDTLLSMLGDDVSNKIRKADLARLKAKTPLKADSQGVNQRSVESSSSPTSKFGTETPEEWKARIRRNLK